MSAEPEAAVRAVVLCAGRGSRLGPLTERVPKPLLPVGGVPLVTRTIRWLVRAGITEMAVNVHTHADAVRACLGDGSQWGASIRYLEEPELLGTAGTVRALAGWLRGGTCLVVYGDNLIGCSLERFLGQHARREALGTIALFAREDVSASGVALLEAEDRIVGFVEKPARAVPSRWVNAGLLALEPQLLDRIPARLPCDLGRDCLPQWAAEGLPLFGYRMGPDEPLVWIDTPQDYEAAQRHPMVMDGAVEATKEGSRR